MGGAIPSLLLTLAGLMPASGPADPVLPAHPGHVVESTFFIGLSPGTGWMPLPGAMPDQGGITVIPGQLDLVLPAGFHDGSGVVLGDEDLVSDNIRGETEIFGVPGSANVVDTSSGNARAPDLAAGRVAWVKGREIQGEAAGARPPRTGQSSSFAPGDDGDHKKGAHLPRPRYEAKGDGTVEDRLTGLVWLENANCSGTMASEFDDDGDGRLTWEMALKLVAALNEGYVECGVEQRDWRLPSIRELGTLVHYGHSFPPLSNANGSGQWSEGDPFVHLLADMYWSSTSAAGKDGDAWYLDLTYGRQGVITKLTEYYVWPVRGGR